jgi:hypothetical protein
VPVKAKHPPRAIGSAIPRRAALISQGLERHQINIERDAHEAALCE